MLVNFCQISYQEFNGDCIDSIDSIKQFEENCNPNEPTLPIHGHEIYLYLFRPSLFLLAKYYNFYCTGFTGFYIFPWCQIILMLLYMGYISHLIIEFSLLVYKNIIL